MKPFVVSPDAADDMNDIWFHLAEHHTIALHRFSEVTLGILVAHLISRLLWPRTTARSTIPIHRGPPLTQID